jgi:dihydroorotate dehydrogenase subfamily 2
MKNSLAAARNYLMQKKYKWIWKPIFFKIDAETIHEWMIVFLRILGKCRLTRGITYFLCGYSNEGLEQNILGLNFKNPAGLAAGFDYEGNLTQILPALGFGFGTVGTITNKPYGGNAKPRLGRLVKSQSLLVNKGFKNPGIQETLKGLEGMRFKIPIGLNIGVTNTPTLSNQDEAIRDIVETFEVAENSPVTFSYYELNISCPNLQVPVEFYSPQRLDELLNAVTKNKLSKPLFIKMPIDKSDNDILDMLEIIVKYPVAGIIFGNLQKDKSDPALDPLEVGRFQEGNFSGKPTEKRSNELISLAYKTYGKKLLIIGCGGIFSPEDAYRKIKLGASLVQLITGMIFEGPQLISDINLGLVKLLRTDGHKNISEAVGKE